MADTKPKSVFVILDEGEQRSFGMNVLGKRYKYNGVALEVEPAHADYLLDAKKGNKADGSGLKWKLADASPAPNPKSEPKPTPKAKD